MFKEYKKIPEINRAVRITKENIRAVIDEARKLVDNDEAGMHIKATVNGAAISFLSHGLRRLAFIGDWLVLDFDGNPFPCCHEVFEATYKGRDNEDI